VNIVPPNEALSESFTPIGLRLKGAKKIKKICIDLGLQLQTLRKALAKKIGLPSYELQRPMDGLIGLFNSAEKLRNGGILELRNHCDLINTFNLV
jgi:hypothetical protein